MTHLTTVYDGASPQRGSLIWSNATLYSEFRIPNSALIRGDPSTSLRMTRGQESAYPTVMLSRERSERAETSPKAKR